MIVSDSDFRAASRWVRDVVPIDKTASANSLLNKCAEINMKDFSKLAESGVSVETFRFNAVSCGMKSTTDIFWLKWLFLDQIRDKECGIVKFVAINTNTEYPHMGVPTYLGFSRDGDNMCLSLNGEAVSSSKLGDYFLSNSCTYMLLITPREVRAYAIRLGHIMCHLFEILDVEKVEYLNSGFIFGRLDIWSKESITDTVLIYP